jgi:hypothetical protein
LFNALKSEMSPNQPRVNDLSLFLSSVAEFADELRSMVHSMYQSPAHDGASIGSGTEHGSVSDLNPSSSEIARSMKDSDPGSVSIQTISDDDHHEDDFVPARHLPNRPSGTQQRMHIENDLSDPIVASRPSKHTPSFVHPPTHDRTLDSSMQSVPPAISSATNSGEHSGSVSVANSNPTSCTPNTSSRASPEFHSMSSSPPGTLPASNASNLGSTASSAPSAPQLAVMDTGAFRSQTPPSSASQSLTPISTSLSSEVGHRYQTHTGSCHCISRPIRY